MKPALMHFYHIQPSELRRLRMSELVLLVDWMEDYAREVERQAG